MADYRLSKSAKEDLIRIHQYGVRRFGESQADKYFDTFFEYFVLIAQQPYSFEAVDFIKEDYPKEREQFFSKGQPCLRASPLTKSYGFGVHSNKEGKVAIYGMETEEYQEFISDKEIIKTKAMRSSRK